jgi:hypothetical protein
MKFSYIGSIEEQISCVLESCKAHLGLIGSFEIGHDRRGSTRMERRIGNVFHMPARSGVFSSIFCTRPAISHFDTDVPQSSTVRNNKYINHFPVLSCFGRTPFVQRTLQLAR